MLRVLSLGAGVQSTTVALMSAVGELPKLDHAIFADTGWEPQGVYRHLDWLETWLALHSIPVHRVSTGNIRENFVSGRREGGAVDHAALYAPVYIRKADGSLGLASRQCTKTYKIVPIRRELARLLGKRPGARWPSQPVVEQWMGISIDEVERTRLSDRAAIVLRYPLVELRMTRGDCLEWIKRQGFPEPPRSACVGCPYRSNAEWRRLRASDPGDFDDAVLVDELMRGQRSGGLDGIPYLHRSGAPLAEADLSTPEDHGQLNWLDGVAAGECEGMCGV